MGGYAFRRLTAAAILMAALPSVCSAAGVLPLGVASQLISGYIKPLLGFLSIVMGIGALFSIAYFIYLLIGGKQEAAKKLVWVIIGLAVGYALMSAVAGMPFSFGAEGAEGLASVKADVKSVLMGCLVIVAMVSMASLTVKIINGEEQAYFRLAAWIMAVSFGSLILAYA